PENRVHYCPNGSPKHSETVLARERKSFADVQILFLSNLMTAKGVFVLLEACEILQQKHLPFHCTFIGAQGDITLGMFQKKVVELGLLEKVEYAGKKYGAEKIEAF